MFGIFLPEECGIDFPCYLKVDATTLGHILLMAAQCKPS